MPTCTKPQYTAPEPRLLYDRKAAAQQLSVSIRTIDYYLQAKALKTRRIGRKVLIPHAELVRFSRADHIERVDAERSRLNVTED